MNDWEIYIKDSSDEWALDETIPRPNDDMTTSVLSTQQKVSLSDGSIGFIVPETKSIKDNFSMFFADTTSALRSVFTGYITNNTFVKLVTHTDEIFIGYIKGMTRVWLVGMEDTYDIEITFENYD